MLRSEGIDYDKEKIAEFETLKTWTATFDNGFIADLKIVANRREDANVYAEAVLFRPTDEKAYTEVACSDCESDEIDGTWYLYYGDDTYAVLVVPVETT